MIFQTVTYQVALKLHNSFSQLLVLPYELDVLVYLKTEQYVVLFLLIRYG